MNAFKKIAVATVVAACVTTPLASFAAEKKEGKAKPYPLDTCIVSGEKLGDGGMKTYTFTYEGQEVKLCCKSCEKNFKKDPAKYLKKIQEAEAKAKDKK